MAHREPVEEGVLDAQSLAQLHVLIMLQTPAPSPRHSAPQPLDGQCLSQPDSVSIADITECAEVHAAGSVGRRPSPGRVS